MLKYFWTHTREVCLLLVTRWVESVGWFWQNVNSWIFSEDWLSLPEPAVAVRWCFLWREALSAGENDGLQFGSTNCCTAIWENTFFSPKTTTCVWPSVKSTIYFTATQLFYSWYMSGMSLIRLQQDDTETCANLKGRKGLISETLCRKFILIASYINISKVQWIQSINVILKLVLTTVIYIFIFCCQSFSISIRMTFLTQISLWDETFKFMKVNFSVKVRVWTTVCMWHSAL